jgi:adenine phosphoribosyltransferase
MLLTDADKKIISDSIRDIQDFPKPGIVFKDITTLLNNKEAFATLMNHLADRYKSYGLDYVAGIDSRGFIFGAALAQMLNIGFVPIRKKGKLPSRGGIGHRLNTANTKLIISIFLSSVNNINPSTPLNS